MGGTTQASHFGLVLCDEMASNGLSFHSQISGSGKPPFPNRHFQVSLRRRIPSRVHSCSSPPSSKEQAISQAKTCLSTTLQKPLNNSNIRFPGRTMKKPKQPRLRLEIPVFDESATSLTELAFLIFGDLPINRKGQPPPVQFLLLWPTPTLAQAATKAFHSSSSSSFPQIQLFHISSLDRLLDNKILNSTDVGVFLWPESSQIQALKAVAEALYPKPVVIFNPKWGFEEETEFGELGGFVGSFEVIYSFMGLEVQGIFSKRKGVVFKCVRNGVLSGDLWNVLVEEEGGELKAVSKFKARPSITQVENVLYNLMAINSPITKSAKFLRDFVSNVTGKN